jgi:hypothetical protein
MSSELSDIEWIERFNEFSKVEFVRRYRKYFKTNIIPEGIKFEIDINKWVNEDLKKELKSLSLEEQYDQFFEVIREEMFNSANNLVVYEKNNPKPKKIDIDNQETEQNVRSLLLVLSQEPDYYKENQIEKWALTKIIFIQNLVSITAILKSIGILQQTNIGKFSQRRNIFVQIDLVIQNQEQQLLLQQLQQIGCLIMAKNHGPILQNQRCRIYLNYCSGSTAEIQKKYDILSDIVITEHNGKVHGWQRDRDPKTGLIDLLVYYEVSLAQRDEVKRKFENYVLIAMSG